MTLLVAILCLNREESLTQIDANAPKSGYWYFNENDERGDAPFKPNASQIPTLFDNKGSASWKLHPKLHSKLKKLVSFFVSAEPQPQYCHRMIDVFAGQKASAGAEISKFGVSLGSRAFFYDENGKYHPYKTPMGGYLPGVVAKFLFNGASSQNESLARLFPVVEGLTYQESKGGPMMPKGLLRACPPSELGYYFTSLDDPEVGEELKKVDIWPKGLKETGAFVTTSSRYITDKETRAKGSLPPWHTESTINALWLANGKFPLDNFITKKVLFDLMEIKSQLEYDKLDAEMRQRAMPEEEKKKASELKYQERKRRQVQISIDLVKRLRIVFKDSLDKIAIINPKYFSEISSGTGSGLAEEEFPINKGGTRSLPLQKLFVDDPSLGYRIGSPTKDYYSGLQPGEIRSIQMQVDISHQVPAYRNFEKLAPAGSMNGFADVPGNVFHSMQYSFPWKKVAELIGS